MKSAGEVIASREAFFGQYQDDRWKAFSKRVREFYANVCNSCRASDKVTQVHHWKYYPGRAPWEYELGEVVLVCAACHGRLHDNLQEFRKLIFPRLPAPAFRVLNGALAVGLSKHDPLELVYAFAEMVAHPGAVKRFAADFVNSPPAASKQKVGLPEPTQVPSAEKADQALNRLKEAVE